MIRMMDMLDSHDTSTGNSRLVGLFVSKRVYLLALVHVAAFAAIYFLAFALRFDFALPTDFGAMLRHTLLMVVFLKLVIFYLFGNFHGWWRYVTFADLAAIVRAATLSLLITAGADYFLISNLQIPRAILLLDWVLTILVLGGLRSGVRFSREHFWPLVRRTDHSKALFVGADESSAALVNRIHNDARLPFRIVGFIDADAKKTGSCLGGIKVLGGWSEIPRLAEENEVRHIVITSGSLPGPAMRALVKFCEDAQLTVRVLPALEDLLNGTSQIQLRDIDINDLLRREPVELDSAAIGVLLKNKTIMVTGAGGSIGSEICRQIIKFHPQRLLLVEKAENSLFYIERELQALQASCSLHPCIADILDRPRMANLFAEYHPDVVFHAAAHKHVPLMEVNVGEAVKNNVLGTKLLADLAHESGVASFVLISTDKAVNPTSVMGVSKQLAERYVHALSQESSTRFVAVRFGNVLGSAGSVVPIFQNQIRRGGPITITDPRMTRYFMTIPEASQLVLQAGAMGRGGEIFVLAMGQPVKILDLAEDLIRLSGLATDAIEIVFTGIRPGEKLFEELYSSEEHTLETLHPKLRAANHRQCTISKISEEIRTLAELADGPDEPLLRKLKAFVPEFRTLAATQDQFNSESECERPPFVPSTKTATVDEPCIPILRTAFRASHG